LQTEEYGHLSHLNFLILSWTPRLCIVNLPLVLAEYEHFSQLNLLIVSWTWRICWFNLLRKKWRFVEIVVSQNLQVHWVMCGNNFELFGIFSGRLVLSFAWWTWKLLTEFLFLLFVRLDWWITFPFFVSISIANAGDLDFSFDISVSSVTSGETPWVFGMSFSSLLQAGIGADGLVCVQREWMSWL